MITNINGGTYFVFAAFLTASIFFVFFFVPETKGLDMESMDVLFGVPDAARRLSVTHIHDEEKAISEIHEFKH